MKRNLLAALACVALLTTVGCASMRESGVIPYASDWAGVMTAGAKAYPEYGGKHCIRTKASETSPGEVLACTGNPQLIDHLYEIPFASGPGSTPTRVWFNYQPMGGDQLRAIGPELKRDVLAQLSAAREARDAEALEGCQALMLAIDGLLDKVSSDTLDQRPPDHHQMRGDLRRGSDVIDEYVREYMHEGEDGPEGDTCAKTADAVMQVIEAAPLSGYLEITGRLDWDK